VQETKIRNEREKVVHITVRKRRGKRRKRKKEPSRPESESRAGQSLIGESTFRWYLDPACTDQRAAMDNY
jgi:hypothetical protein